ncbi:hypothetical protein F4553_002258 [Allocatelliglobosispora scoriae]|uniref:Uncharacterized protein n=1 Tax=Allocatelliglobosispora scoriae TaxID=643052 RepID=A0A841BNV6_9ACTN|nr:hypothetical protein [Allocatelliglobosispora scoriae]MBB5868879.1 hypothetical protein [Allocatelliglobosispora scoriae]
MTATGAMAGALLAFALIGWPSALSAAPVVLLTHKAATDQLRAAGIAWISSGNCTNRNNPECTSFERIRQSTIDGVITLRTASRCPITVTGGTETGHGTGTYTHWNGWKLDIARWACVSAYIGRNFAYVGYISGWGHQYRAPSGNIYTDEGNHWDILYYTCGGCTVSSRPAPPPVSVAVSPSASPSGAPSASPQPGMSPAVKPLPSGSNSSSGEMPDVAGYGRSPYQPGPEPEPSGPPVVDALRIHDHLG